MPAMLVVDMVVVVIVMLRMRVPGHLLMHDSRVRGGMVVMMMPRTAMIVRVMFMTGMKRRRVRQDRRKLRRGSAVK